MDFSQLQTNQVEEGAWMIITAPNGEDTDAKLLLAGIDSKAYRQAQNEFIEKRSKSDSVSGEQYRGARRRIVAACTLGAENLNEGGKVIEASNKAVLEQFLNKYPFVMEQAEDFIAKRSNHVKSVEIEKKSESGQLGDSA